jgi:intermediate peptidase
MNIPSHQERSVGHLLKSDFEKSGILLSVNSKDKFVTLNNKINSLGQEFLYAYQDKTITIKDPFNKLSGIPHSVITQFIENDAISFPANSEVGVMLLNYCTNESIRRLVYMEMNSGSDEQVDLLERMLNARYELARLLGKNSYAEYWLDGKMVSSPGITNYHANC